jgi:hypothetical protein
MTVRAARSFPSALSRRHLLLTGSAAIGAGTLFGAGRVGAAQSSSSARSFDVRAAGATGQRADNATHAFQSAIDACTAAGGGIVRVPPGAYTVGMIQLKDNVPLDLDAGATLFLSQDHAQFLRGRRAMVFAEDASNNVSDFAIDGFAGRQGLLWRQTPPPSRWTAPPRARSRAPGAPRAAGGWSTSRAMRRARSGSETAAWRRVAQS